MSITRPLTISPASSTVVSAVRPTGTTTPFPAVRPLGPGINPIASAIINAATIFKPLTIPGITTQPVGVLPQPSTAQKYAQAYTVQSFDANGKLVTRTISLSKLQTQDQDFSENQVSQSERYSEAQLIGDSTISGDKLTKILQDSIKIDYFLCLRSDDSSPVEYNTMQTPVLKTGLVYNFYEPNENDIFTQEDPDQDPLLQGREAPRYVSFSWKPIEQQVDDGSFKARTKEELQLANMYLKRIRGNATTANSAVINDFSSAAKSVNPIFRDGKALSITDTHDLPSAFNSLTNGKIYKKNAQTVFNINPIDIDKVKLEDVLMSKFNGK